MKQLRSILLTITLCIFVGIFVLTITANLWSACGLLILFLLFVLLKKNRKIQIEKQKIQEIGRKIQPYFPILLFAFSFFFRFCVLLILRIEQYSDYYTLLTAAECLADGKNIMPDSPYYTMWGFQTGFILYQTVILKVFQSEMMLNFFDCIYTSSICVFIYQMAKDLWKQDCKIPSILYAVYLFAVAYTGILSNQHLYNFLALIGIWLWLRKEKSKKHIWKKYFGIAVIFGFANIIRTEMVLILVALLLYELIKIQKKQDIIDFGKKLLILLGTYFVITQGASYLIKVTGINPSGLENKNMLWKFVCGSDYESGGRYSTRAEDIIDDHEAEREFIRENYTSLTLIQWIDFIGKKINNFWTQDSYQWAFNNTEEVESSSFQKGMIAKTAKILDGMGYLVIFFFALVSMERIRKQEISTKDFFAYLLLVHFFVYLVIEVQPRYAYLARILLFLLATDGISQWENVVDEWKQKKAE